jgi:hypothetical protein
LKKPKFVGRETHDRIMLGSEIHFQENAPEIESFLESEAIAAGCESAANSRIIKLINSSNGDPNRG